MLEDASSYFVRLDKSFSAESRELEFTVQKDIWFRTMNSFTCECTFEWHVWYHYWVSFVLSFISEAPFFKLTCGWSNWQTEKLPQLCFFFVVRFVCGERMPFVLYICASIFSPLEIFTPLCQVAGKNTVLVDMFRHLNRPSLYYLAMPRQDIP